MRGKIRIGKLAMLLAGAVFMTMAFSLTASGKERGKMVFAKTSHDFGIVKENGGPVACEFTFTNEGDGNLVIYNAMAECGCTRPDFPKAPIAPGKSGVIKVTYNPLGRPGAFDKVVTIRTNGSPAKLRVKIKGSVMPKDK